MNRSKGVLLVIVAGLLVLTWFLLEPFLPYVLGAVLIAYVLQPLNDRLERYTSATVAAFTIVIVGIALFVAPVAIVIARVAGDASRILQNLDPDVAALQTIEERIAALTGQDIDIAGRIASSGQEIGSIIFERSVEAFGTISHFVLGIALLVFLVYYMVKDGDDLIAWLRGTIPIPAAIQRELQEEIDAVMWAVLVGHVFVAVVQGAVAGVGLIVTGIPNAVFWTVIMMVLAMIPIIGAVPVWGGAVVYLYLAGDLLLAVALLVYCIVVVGLTDDYLRPFAVNRYTQLNPAVILVGILGGGYAFGIMGLFFGPVIFGALKATLQVVSDNWEQLEDSEA